MSIFTRRGWTLFLLTVLALVCLAGCGSNFPSTSTQQAGLSNIPTGKGNDPEQGTDGQPKPAPDGHRESVLVANGITYVGSDNGQLYAFGSQDGKIRWQHQENANQPRAIVGGIIYATDTGSDDMVYALNATNGAVLWQRSMNQTISDVEVVNGIVYVNTSSGNGPSVISALQATNGTLLWQYSVSSTFPSLAGISNGRVYDASIQGTPGEPNPPQTIFVLDAASGHLLWQLPIKPEDGLVRGKIVEVNGVAYLSTNQGSAYAVHADSGQVIWHVSQSVSGFGGKDYVASLTPAVSNGIVYAGSVQNVFAYRASDGKQLWQYHLNAMGGPPTGLQPLVANGVVYIAPNPPQGTLVALHASDGTPIWQHPGAAISPDGLAFVDGLLINQIGDVTAWRGSDGSQVWEHNTDNGEGPPGPGSSVDIGEGTIYVGGQNGIVEAMRISDGTLLWKYQIQEQPVQSPPVYSASVVFSNSTTYDQAIQIVGDLGLKTFAMCRFDWSAAQDNRDIYTSNHQLTVTATTNSAPLWLERLQALPQIAQVYPEGVHSCPQYRPSGVQNLPESQAGVYLKVTFSSSAAYIKAWESVNGLGFRLAAPCYEKARAQGNKPTWHPMGEEDSFGQTHILVLATTPINTTTWRQQLQSIPGIGQIEVVSGAASFSC